jgi:TonB-dependent receptor-like protein
MTLRSAIRLGLVAAVLYPALPRAQAPACTVAGAITSDRIPLPGVLVTLVSSDDRAVDVSSSAPDGTYALRVPLPGGYTLKTELTAFAPASRQLTIDQSNCSARVDLTMTLASRAAGSTPPAAAAPLAGRTVAGRGQARTPPQQFQSLALLADQAGLARDETANGDADVGAQTILPPGFSADASAESVTAVGTSQQNDLFFGPNGPGDFAQRFGFDRAEAGRAGGAGRGGPEGFGGGGFGPGFGGPFGRGGRGNQIRGSIFQSADTSALDAAPYALNGQATAKPQYLQQRFGATIGGPLTIPKIIDNPRTFFFLNYTGNHSRSPYDAYSTVPTLAERAGDLSALGRAPIDPLTGQPFADRQIPASRLDPAAQRLLAFIPAPNQTGLTQNFHTVTTVTNQLDDINVRLIHVFGAVPQRGRGQGGGRGFGGGRGGGGPGGRAGVSNLNVTIHYRHGDNANASPFPTLGGTSTTTAWDVPVNYSFTKAGMPQSIRFGFNRQHTESQNLYANSENVAAAAGLLGAAADPFDWGVPNLSFSGFASVRDLTPSLRTDRTLSIGDTITKTKNAHTFRFGGDLRSIHADSRVDANARGSYVFTGLYSGVDLGDFLLGLPQQASLQFGPGLEQFRSTSWDLFAQDDWRATDKLTVNAGLRYEFYSPVAEASNRLVTLDVPPTFTTAVPVAAGESGPFSGALPDTIVRPFRAGLAPRLGVAWRPSPGNVIRTGYSINYNSSVYQTIAQQLAGQPPFATTDTAIATAASPLLLESALASVAPGVTANTYAIDPNYRLPFVQIWNVDWQRDLTRTLQFGIGYTGTKGSDLDLLRAPNRTPTGLRIADVAPFIYESSSADSIMQSLTLRLRKRLTNGFAVGGSYTLSKSIDDASSIAGAGGTVAQNDQDLAAERGLSNFDQRHRLAADFTRELPFGFVINGNLQLASGTPFTARILGAITDVARGTNGTLRANYNGAPIAAADPTALLFFNTAAFSIPAPGAFGNAGRNTIIGPGTSTLNFGLTKNINFSQTRGLSIQVLANNLLNDVQFASIDTNVNSPTFGQVTAVRPMRRISIQTRFRF